MKKHNFYAGPSILSEYTIKNTAAAVENFAGMGLSLLEISHRSKEFVAVNDEARALIKELLDVPAGYEVVFMVGIGRSTCPKASTRTIAKVTPAGAKFF